MCKCAQGAVTFVHMAWPLATSKSSAETLAQAVTVATLYYYQGLTTGRIAQELGLSRSKVSRLLSFAREQGIVRIEIQDPVAHAQGLEARLCEQFGLRQARVVAVSETAGEREWLRRVAAFSAHYLNTLVEPGMILALAWGTTMSAIAEHLIPKGVREFDVVQLNGSGNTHNISDRYASEIIMRFARNYQGRAHLLPVPTFFDFPDTKRSLWRDRSIRRITDMQAQADILLYSVGAVEAGVPSHVYTGGYLESQDLLELERERIVGDIATVFFRGDGSYRDIPLNARASGPDLSLFQRARHALCVVSGKGKMKGVRAALQGGYIGTLIIDEPSARYLLGISRGNGAGREMSY